MVNNYLKTGLDFEFFDDRDRSESIRMYVKTQELVRAKQHCVVYKRPNDLWKGVPAVGDGIGALAEPEELETDADSGTAA